MFVSNKTEIKHATFNILLEKPLSCFTEAHRFSLERLGLIGNSLTGQQLNPKKNICWHALNRERNI